MVLEGVVKLARTTKYTKNAVGSASSFRFSPSGTDRMRFISPKNNAAMRISDEVRMAGSEGKPIVALETTIYTHGYPSPENKHLALELEAIVRDNGGIPATIGVYNNTIEVGMSQDKIADLCDAAGTSSVVKLSRRDLTYPYAVGRTGTKLHGGTTIAATMILAARAGIRVFATGGLGGVHRGAESSMDISADLTELGRTPVAVVASGCKGFLDIPRTLEYLETQGVPVVTFRDGRKGEVDFPAFWSRDSGVRSPLSIDSPVEAAAMILASGFILNASERNGFLFANPVPQADEIPKSEMQAVITQALLEAEAANHTGRDNTPFVLAKIKELTEGRSIAPNSALIKANAKVATEIAKELATMRIEEEGKEMERDEKTTFVGVDAPAVTSQYTTQNAVMSKNSGPDGQSTTIPTAGIPPVAPNHPTPDIIVAGSLAMDYACDYLPSSPSTPTTSTPNPTPQLQTSNPARITPSLGGVAHNIAKAAHYLGANVQLCSIIANDLSGKAALSQLQAEGMRTDGIVVSDKKEARTAQYIAVNDAKRDLFVAVADMGIIETEGDKLRPLEGVGGLVDGIGGASKARPKWLVLDANLKASHLRSLLEQAKPLHIKTAFEPVSVAKSLRILDLNKDNPLPVYPNHLVTLTTPNTHELSALHTQARTLDLLDRKDWFAVIDALGIPSSGARNRLVSLTNKKLVDEGVPQRALQLLPFFPVSVVKLGAEGVLLTQILEKDDPRLSEAKSDRYILSRNLGADLATAKSPVGGVYMRLFGAAERVPEEEVVSVNGVGDTFLGALLAASIHAENRGEDERGIEDLIDYAQRAACLSLRSGEAVSPELRGLRG